MKSNFAVFAAIMVISTSASAWNNPSENNSFNSFNSTTTPGFNNSFVTSGEYNGKTFEYQTTRGFNGSFNTIGTYDGHTRNCLTTKGFGNSYSTSCY